MDQFVRQSLVQIVGGARDASAEVRKFGGIVNPAIASAEGKGKEGHFATTIDGESVFLIDFDVAVMVHESDEVGGAAKAGVLKVFSDRSMAKLRVRRNQLAGFASRYPWRLRSTRNLPIA